MKRTASYYKSMVLFFHCTKMYLCRIWSLSGSPCTCAWGVLQILSPQFLKRYANVSLKTVKKLDFILFQERGRGWGTKSSPTGIRSRNSFPTRKSRSFKAFSRWNFELYTSVYSSKAWMKWAFDDRVSTFSTPWRDTQMYLFFYCTATDKVRQQSYSYFL